MPPDFHELSDSIPKLVEIDCLLPNGILITIQCSRDLSLNQLKTKVWEENKKYMFINNEPLKHMDNYIFVSITQEAKNIEYYDNEKRIYELKLFYAIFQLVEVKGDLIEKSFNSNLCKVIGLYSNEIEQNKDLEIIEFRLELLRILQKILKEQNLKKINQDYASLIDCIYPPHIEIDPSLFDVSVLNTAKTLDDFSFSNKKHLKTSIDINVHVMETDQQTIFDLNVPLYYTPTDVIKDVIKKKLFLSKHDNQQIEEIAKLYKNSYEIKYLEKRFVKKFLDISNFIFKGDTHTIASYKYVQKCSSNNKKPNFHLISFDKLKSNLSIEENYSNFLVEKCIINQEEILKKSKEISHTNLSNTEISWNSDEVFILYLDNLIYLPHLKDCEKLFFKIAIYHSQEIVTHNIESERFDLEKLGKDSSLKLNQNLNLGIQVKNLHRTAKLCLSLYCISKKKREFFSIGWLNLNLFDFNGYLINGKKKLYLWNPSQSTSFSYECSSEVTGQNPEKDYIRLHVDFFRSDKNIIYPQKEEIKNFIKKTSNINSQDECFDCSYALENDNSLLENILNKDSLAELSEQEKNVLWRRREDCLNYPHSLPKLLQSVKWSNKNEVIEIYNLLYKWPEIKPTIAIELLHYSYSDLQIRNFAVKCLDKNMKDEEVHQYLLQLIQTLKNEPYYDNLLTRFLLRRALKSQRIGFEFFWNLKSEMKNPRYKLRFGLILEAYCRGIGSLQLKNLLKQVEVVEKLSLLSQEIKNNNEKISDLAKSSFLEEVLKKPDYAESLSNFICPLNRSHLLGKVNIEKCRILTSAKRPLYLTWTNSAEYAAYYQDNFELIFKHGDDLRQDMLTLQVIKLMDLLWKNEGLDLKMQIYDCFSTGFKTGFIEVIKEATTIFKIQMEGGIKGRYQIDTQQLYKWLCQNNPNIDLLDLAIENFTNSCAGFSVATFILGIGDRHPDNIMVNKEGKLFHIDFGHFLGHFKTKYGIKRERTPFVLTEDFTKVISKGSQNPIETDEFKRFQMLCENAYMIVRRYSHLIINLFILMLSSDMPELQSIEDIMFLRKTLAIDESDEKALEFFREQFCESYKHSYTTKLDWFAHALNRKNLI